MTRRLAKKVLRAFNLMRKDGTALPYSKQQLRHAYDKWWPDVKQTLRRWGRWNPHVKSERRRARDSIAAFATSRKP